MNSIELLLEHMSNFWKKWEFQLKRNKKKAFATFFLHGHFFSAFIKNQKHKNNLPKLRKSLETTKNEQKLKKWANFIAIKNALLYCALQSGEIDAIVPEYKTDQLKKQIEELKKELEEKKESNKKLQLLLTEEVGQISQT